MTSGLSKPLPHFENICSFVSSNEAFPLTLTEYWEIGWKYCKRYKVWFTRCVKLSNEHSVGINFYHQVPFDWINFNISFQLNSFPPYEWHVHNANLQISSSCTLCVVIMQSLVWLPSVRCAYHSSWREL